MLKHYGVSFLLWSNHQMGLLTSFHILFDMSKEDIGNSNQPEGEREDRKDIYPGRLSPTKRSTLSQASNHLSFRFFRVSCLPHYMYCTVLYILYLTLPSSNRVDIVYCIPIEPDECPRITKASQSVSQSQSQSQSNHQAVSDTN